MLRSVFSGFLLLSALLLGGCTKDDAPVPAPVYLLDQRWVLTELNGQTPPGPTETTLLLPSAATRASGQAACNQYGGTYTLAAGSPQLHFGPQAATKATCPSQLAEYHYLSLLPQVERYLISGQTLQLFDATHAQPLLVFRVAQ